jgi:Mg2+ and Co2+ transporter CorA
MSSHEENVATIILSPFALITGYFGLNLANIDLCFAILLKLVSIISVVLIIAVNWRKGINQIKEWFKWK